MSGLKKSEGYFFKEAQAAPMHERGHAAMSKIGSYVLANIKMEN
jgi:hypothetical protein